MSEHSSELKDLAAALAKAQATVKGAKKDSANPFFKSSYADLSSVWEACREALTANGLSVVQLPGFEVRQVPGSPTDVPIATVETILLHSSGQWISGTAGAPIAKQDAQGVGSVITYLRRYALAAVASVSPEDDDGNAGAAPRRTTAKPDLSQKPAALDGPDAPIPTAPPVLKWKEKPLMEYASDDLLRMRAWCVKNDPKKWATYIEAMDALLEARRGE